MIDKPKDDTSELRGLGSASTNYFYRGADFKLLETFPNAFADKRKSYSVELVFPEFTSLCPKTGQPDFATITIRYRPRKECVESKSLKLYLFSYRNEGAFMETITNTIWWHLMELLCPEHLSVTAAFRPRGGIALVVSVTGHTYRNKEGLYVPQLEEDDEEEEEF